MEHGASNENSLYEEDNSLGILNIDNLKYRAKFFSDLPSDSLKSFNYVKGSNEIERRVSDRLNNERMKALEALQKSKKSGYFNKSCEVKSKENISSNNPLTQFDHTDYVPFRRPNAINISDLVTDETINLESSSSCPSLVSKDIKVSFEPAEITGRSTLYNKDIKNRNNIPLRGSNFDSAFKIKHISVNDILASSFAPEARNLCETLQKGDSTLDITEGNLCGISSVSSTSTCSLFTSLNGSKSLPRTADMSTSKHTFTEELFNGDFGTFSFSSAGAGTDVDESEEFAPGELMKSKLVSDEILWAQEYAAIPAATLSKEAKVKASQNSGVVAGDFNSPSATNSAIVNDPNFSVGHFFNMRSDNIWNIVKSESPNKCRTPVALVDEEDNTVTTTTLPDIESSSNISITPKIDSKTYTRVGTSSLEIEKILILRNVSNEKQEKINFTDNSYLLSISAIDRALCNLDIQLDASGIGVSEKLLMQGKKTKSSMNPYFEVTNQNNGREMRSKVNSFGSDIKMCNTIDRNLNIDAEMILENKENLDPDTKRPSNGVAPSDTMSFSESLLNSSDMKRFQRSASQPRSPLSPIDVDVPNIRISQVEDGEEADADEWPGTPTISNRRIRRTKSPRDKSPLPNNTGMEDSPDAITPLSSIPSRSYILKNRNKTVKEPESMSSTRIDGGDNNCNTECVFAVSPNISDSHQSASCLAIRSNTLVVPQTDLAQGIPSPRLGTSPLSSPCNYSQSQMASPTPTTIGFRSPNLDVTVNSDRHLLSAGAITKVVSSPVGSESSSTCSYGTMQTYRSAVSGTSGRSVSRCSSSSEFSHRDGKQIPLKVTNTELSWGSIKLRSDSRKSMQVKNIINKRLVIRIEICGPGFQIVDSQRSNTLTLHSQECRSISISFCPTVRGVAIGKLSFYAPNGAPTIGQSFLDVALYGYGGNASIIAQNIYMGPVGSPFVTMGNVCELAQPLERTISFYNKGPLLGFAAVSIDSIGLMMPRLSDAFEIDPQRILIPSKNVVDVRIVFRPKREAIKKLIKKMGSVLTLANMRVICGDEANRQRIRSLLAQMTNEERAKLSSSALDMLWTKFPNEKEMQDLHDIKENPNVAMDLVSFFRIHEILLTINHDNMDDTIEASSLFLPDVDETVLFRTICAANSPTPSSNLRTVNELIEEFDTDSNVDNRAVITTRQGFWSVSPKSIEISLSEKKRYSLSVYNGFKSRKFFEVVCNLKDVLQCSPGDGYVAPDGGQTEINIGLHRSLEQPIGNVCVIIYIENERIVVPVKIVK